MSDISLSPAAAPRAWPRLGRTYRALRPYLYLFPALACFIIWIYEPLGRAFLLSFQQWNLLPTSPKIWVGLDNYRNIFDLPKFWQALGNPGWYLVGSLTLACNRWGWNPWGFCLIPIWRCGRSPSSPDGS